MPVEYKGLRAEHMNTRANVGLFDVSHMGEIRVRGPKALEALQWLTSNDVAKVNKGQAQYGLLMNEEGGIVDDLIIYCLEPDVDYLVCVNASNTDKDFNWMMAHNPHGAQITNESEQWGQIAVQGPKALELLSRVFGRAAIEPPSFHFSWQGFEGAQCIVARTGYTGEDGAEVFVPAAKTVALWRELLRQGEDLGVQAIGLGARDTLRTEMKYSLYGHEIDDSSSPYEAGLGWVVKPDAKDFVGKKPMLERKADGLKQKLIGLMMTERGIPRAGYTVFSNEEKEIGKVTSGTVSPSLNDNIGIAYVDAGYAEVGTQIKIDIRGRKVGARIVKTPFVEVKK